MSEAAHEEEGGHQEHPLALYFWIWILLFVLSGFSYAVDFVEVQGYLRWTLILMLMVAKAGFITAIFMHMRWERLALKVAILSPPVAILIFMGMMMIEADYTFLARMVFFKI